MEFPIKYRSNSQSQKNKLHLNDKLKFSDNFKVLNKLLNLIWYHQQVLSPSHQKYQTIKISLINHTKVKLIKVINTRPRWRKVSKIGVLIGN